MQNIFNSPRKPEGKIFTVWAFLFIVLLVGIGVGLAKGTPKEEEEVFPQTEVLIVEKCLTDWDVLQLAIMMTESEFNPEAVGTSGDWGIMQITEIYTKEANRIQGYSKYVHEDAFDIDRSLEMFNVVQSYYNPERDVEKALKYHNRASWYANRVKKNMELIRRMERGREAVLNMKKDLFIDDIGTLQNVRD